MANPTKKLLSCPANSRRPLAWVKITGEGEESQSGVMQYMASVILDPKNNEADAATVKSIDDFFAEHFGLHGKKKPKSLGYYLNDPLLDADGEKQFDDDDHIVRDPNGKVILTFKTGTTFKDGNRKVVKIYNAKNKVVSLGDQTIGNESEGIISGAMGIYVVKNKGKVTTAGVTLYLDAIQLKKFVPYEGADAGFGASDDDDEDGFTSVDEDQGFEGEETKSKPRL